MRLTNFVLGFMLPFVVFMLAAAPVASRPVPLQTCSLAEDTQKLQNSQFQSAETSEDGSEDALGSGAQELYAGVARNVFDCLHSHPDFTDHRILDHAHDGRGPPSIS